MNSYMRQSTVPADQMHSFLKDKQAWENAIVLYQGPDPLDHWWNYICWYENHGHGDPDNKFRETLERCLTLYEHSDYYKQDLRMVCLWLKYIDMQSNPLHFYQVLHQRGVGKQSACFYVGWATYYESVNAFKEAEAVYNLAFQEKAQPYADLHHAHSKLMYTKSVHAQTLSQQQQSQHPHYQQQPQPAVSTASVTQIQQPQTVQHVQTYRQQLSYHHAASSQQPQQMPQAVAAQSPVAHQHVHPAAVHHQVQPPAAQQMYHHQPAHSHYPPQQMAPQQHLPQQHQVHATQQQHHQQGPQPVPPSNIHPHQLQATATQVSPQVYSAHHPTHQQTTNAPQPPPQQTLRNVPVEQQLPPATANMTRQQYERAIEASAKRIEDPSTTAASHAAPTDDIQVSGIKSTRKFAAYCRNNHETWQPALFLEEPDDPQKVCYYNKTHVYPPDLGKEYSPEEIKAWRYKQKIDELKQKQKQHLTEQQLNLQQLEPQPQLQQVTSVQVQEIGSIKTESVRCLQQPPPHHPQQPAQQQQIQQQAQHFYGQQQQQLHHINNNHLYYQQQQRQQQETPQMYHHPQQQQQQTTETSHYEVQNQYEQQRYQHQQYPKQQAEADDEEEAETEEDQEGDNQDTEEDEQQYQNHQNHLQRQQLYQTQQNHAVSTQDDLEDQIEASTIRFSMHTPNQGSQNKTIKIKFKKERPTVGATTPNGKNYSAYTVESIYQPELDSPSMSENAIKRNGNNHSFHPYLLGQTSTPKTSAKRQKSKIKKASNKFHVLACHNSNSSSVENGHATAINNNLPKTPSTASDINKAHLNATFNDNANYSFSSAVALDNSNCSLSNAVGRLNFRDASALNNSTLNQSNAVDISTYQENSYFSTQHDAEAKELRLSKALETIERHMAKEAIDPFSSELCRAFLTKLDFPGSEGEAHANYKIVQTPLPKIANTRHLSLAEGIQFNIDKEIGRGSYGSVYKATDVANGAVVALKFQKPANTWEIYICDQVLKRIQSPNILPGLMDISTAIIAPNASIIATEFSPYGSLLDINNKIRQATTKVMHESLVMHFSAQICNIIRHLHQNKIIHADIKPDNFLLMRVPSTDLHFPSLRLIDFGCAIDMTLFPDGNETKFRKVIQTDGFTCIEMQEGRSWSYETDLFCIAGTVHVMLFGEYMQLQKRAGTWDIKQKLPRYLKKHVWTQFFGDMLNIKQDTLPDLSEMRNIFEEEASRMDSELQKQMRALSNILHRR